MMRVINKPVTTEPTGKPAIKAKGGAAQTGGAQGEGPDPNNQWLRRQRIDKNIKDRLKQQP